MATTLLVVAGFARASVLSDNLDQLPLGPEVATVTEWLTASFATDAKSYDLTTVVLRVGSSAASDAVVDIYSSVGTGAGEPGVLVGTLTYSGMSGSLPVFAAQGIVLDPSTTYWVVVREKPGGGSSIFWTWTPSDAGTGVGFQHTWGFSDDSGGSWTIFDQAPLMMQVNAEELAFWTDLGSALPGMSGPPQLKGYGQLLAGSNGLIVLTFAAPSAPSLLFLSAGAIVPTSFKGGTLLPVPVLLALPLHTDALGSATLPWAAWPPGVSGLDLYFQAGIQDAAAVKGVALSNALAAHVP
ncbi:MAG TPA: choice-of-anchor R domain-containing protein [Planctomycetota bacterium]|nr:choice-of-anchor R domain-containing protein [Planctomycetota bacterium]